MGDLSARLRRRIAKDFPGPGSADEVGRLVAGAAESERVQAGIVLFAQGDIEKIRSAVGLAKVDWRDVLVNGGLADENWPDILDMQLGPS